MTGIEQKSRVIPREDDDTESNQSWVCKPVSLDELIESHPQMRPIVVDGILRRGETLNIIAAAKVGKSFLAILLAWCIASGRAWLGHDVIQGRVLIIDNELHGETLKNRLCRVGVELMEDHPDVRANIDVVTLRGRSVDIHSLESKLSDIESGYYSLVIIDALYRFLPEKTSENDNAQMMAVYNRLDALAKQWDTAIAVVHHASKGGQGDKSITDVGAGAGSISRAADTHLIIRPHEDEELSVLELVTRSFKSPPARSVRFEWPLWSEVDSEPLVKKLRPNGAAAKEKQDAEDCAALLAELPPVGKRIQQARLKEKLGFGEGKFRRLAGMLIQDEQMKLKRSTPKGKSRAQVYYVRLVAPGVAPVLAPEENRSNMSGGSNSTSGYVIPEAEELTPQSEVENKLNGSDREITQEGSPK